ncbi:phage tailspike protein [Xenorhabdus bovienii]|uniref:phage head-binding domain-containing protein n=1 Tax=Xenorhabdus bovienii TaxID=40576 RepID=UPI003DA29346
MSEIIPNVVVSMPSQLFTMARSFKACSNGMLYIGKIDTDPTIPENQIQVYMERENGDLVPAPQPIIINAAGYPVYAGQIAKFVTVEGHSMAIYDSYGVQQFYFQNVLKYSPDRLKQQLDGDEGYKLIPSIENKLIPDLRILLLKSNGDIRGWGITPDSTNIADKLQSIIDEGVKIIRIPAGLYNLDKTIRFDGSSQCLHIEGGVELNTMNQNIIPFSITNEFCVQNNIVVLHNDNSNLFVGKGMVIVKNIGFIALKGQASIENRYNSNSCFKESDGHLNVRPNGCKFLQFYHALDFHAFPYSHSIVNNSFQHNKVAIFMEGATFNVHIKYNVFTENGIGVYLDSGDSIDVSDNNFALDAANETIGIKTNGVTDVSFDRNYFEDYGDVNIPKKGIGSLCYDIKFNSHSRTPDSISIFGNIMNMQSRSDYCVKLDNLDKSIELHLYDFNIKKNTMINSKKQIFVVNGSNLAMDLIGLSVENPYLYINRVYSGRFNKDGSKNGDKDGYGLTCSKLSSGQYRVSLDTKDPTRNITAQLTPITNKNLFYSIQNVTHRYIDVLFRDNNNEVDSDFFIFITSIN